MIALDSSALIAMVKAEAEGPRLAQILSENDCIIGAPTRFETEMVVFSQMTEPHWQYLQRLLRLKNITTVDYTPEHAQVSQTAFAIYGKGTGHRAHLNFGDCMAYAVARVAGAPLLFKGNDFAQTDIIPAFLP